MSISDLARRSADLSLHTKNLLTFKPPFMLTFSRGYNPRTANPPKPFREIWWPKVPSLSYSLGFFCKGNEPKKLNLDEDGNSTPFTLNGFLGVTLKALTNINQPHTGKVTKVKRVIFLGVCFAPFSQLLYKNLETEVSTKWRFQDVMDVMRSPRISRDTFLAHSRSQ